MLTIPKRERLLRFIHPICTHYSALTLLNAPYVAEKEKILILVLPGKILNSRQLPSKQFFSVKKEKIMQGGSRSINISNYLIVYCLCHFFFVKCFTLPSEISAVYGLIIVNTLDGS